ncbi:MAG: hypothetical protein IIU14_08945 [Ruminococcus sp.]|nr:hypothetical protein [Ruminococcus sp.]
MSLDGIAFFLILAINFIITFIYWLYYFIIRKKYEAGFATRCMVMLLCPVVGPVYFFLGWVLRKVLFHKPVDLADVIFSKERGKSLIKADEFGESNIIPIKDAVSVVDKENARELMLEVLRHDVRKSLSSLFLALDSDDSEISHYAASVLQSELGKFRLAVQDTVSDIDEKESELRAYEKYDGERKTPEGELYSKRLDELSGKEPETLREEEGLVKGREKEKRKTVFADISDKMEQSEDFERHEIYAYEQGMRAFYGDEVAEETLKQKLFEQVKTAHELISDIYEVVTQNVFTELESIHFTELSDRMAHLLEKRDTLSAEEMARMAECWRLRKNYEKCAEWSDRLFMIYPDSLEAFSTKLKLSYDKGDRESFFATLNEMKSNGVPLDHEMMEMVRVFA